ncbi:MAG: tetratricopeptide repeat protein [Terrimicrobium sp.]
MRSFERIEVRPMSLMRQYIRDIVACATGMLLVLEGCAPKRSASSPEEEIREGWQQYRLSEFNAAVKIFRVVEASQPRGSEYHIQALYGEASCWNHRRDGRDIARAVAGYRAVIEEAPDNPLAAWCALDIVRTRHLVPADQTIDYQALVRDYADVYRRYPQTPAGEEAFLYGSNLALPRAGPEEAGKLLQSVNEFLASHPKTPYLSQFYGIIAECYRKMDEPDRRIDYLIKALQARPVEPSTPSDDRSTAYWNIAYAAEFEAGNFPLAREYYERLMTEYPQDIRVFGARRALERMNAVEMALREGRQPEEAISGSAPARPQPTGQR